MSFLDAFRQDTAKQRALRIPLDYAKEVHWVSRWKISLTVFASLVAIAYCMWAGVSPEGISQLSPGSVASVHAAWENDCQACHLPGVPLRGDADGSLWVSRWLVEGSTGNPHLADQKCTHCHAGPAHHAAQLDSEVATCAACHVDHQGATADLNRVVDAQCVRCHSDLASHRQKKANEAGELVKNVVAFGLESHPPFRSIAGSDPGNIRFSHALHMLPGQAAADTPAKLKKKLSDLPEAFRSQYREGDSGLIELACGNCHQADASSGGSSLPTDGAYMQPIMFEQHCQACHPLHLAADTPGEVPHGLQGQKLRSAVIAAQFTAAPQKLSPNKPVELAKSTTKPNIPGQPFSALDQELADKVDMQLGLLRANTCALCHGPPAVKVGLRIGSKGEEATADEKTTKPENETPDSKLESSSEEQKERSPETANEGNDILPANLPAVWFNNARFSHSAHQAVKCAECHAATFATPSAAATKKSLLDHDQILIPGLDNCVRCHAPGKVRSDCAECHRYHAVDEPIALSNLKGRQQITPLDRDAFLSPMRPATFSEREESR